MKPEYEAQKRFFDMFGVPTRVCIDGKVFDGNLAVEAARAIAENITPTRYATFIVTRTENGTTIICNK